MKRLIHIQTERKTCLTQRSWTALSFALILFLSSCVGTIEDTEVQEVNNVGQQVTIVEYPGIQMAEAISHERVEIFFEPAGGTETENTYQIYVNDTETPILVNGESLALQPNGLFKYTLTGLNGGRSYRFRVAYYNKLQGIEATSSNFETTTTFPYEVAEFAGISRLVIPPGNAGKTSMRVEWIPATKYGSNVFPQLKDATQYEIRWISASNGGYDNINGPTASLAYYPTGVTELSGIPSLSYFDITGLTPGEEYSVQVRALHKGWIIYQNQPGYKREMNTNFLVARTRSGAEMMNFDGTLVQVQSAAGSMGRTSLDISWPQADGDFENYRTYVVPVGGQGTVDQLQESGGGTNLDNLAYWEPNPTTKLYRVHTAEKLNFIQEALTPYGWYHVKVVACATQVCGPGDRSVSPLFEVQVRPLVAPFSGLTDVTNPDNPNDPFNRYIKMHFDRAVTEVGVVDRMDLLCLPEGTSDKSKWVTLRTGIPVAKPNAMIADQASHDNLPTNNCGGLLRLTGDKPTGSWDDFTQIEVALETLSASDPKAYCFGINPVIDQQFPTITQIGDSVNYTYPSNVSVNTWTDNTVFRCVVPEFAVPSASEFPGKISDCTDTYVDHDSLTVRWRMPSGGLYTNYVVFIRKNNGTPFSFTAATAEYIAAGGAVGGGNEYYWATGIVDPPGATPALNQDHTFTDFQYDPGTGTVTEALVPGGRYQTGILTYAVVGGDTLFSEFNGATSSCTMKMPKARFNSWTDIVALGPKENGLIPEGPLGVKRYIPEGFNHYGLPVEVVMEDESLTEPKVTVAGAVDDMRNYSSESSVNGDENWDGTYGRLDGLIGNPPHRYSNQGMVRIAFEDVDLLFGPGDGSANAYKFDTFWRTTFGSVATQNAYPKTDPDTPGSGLRIHGYKILRSDDGKLSWTDLTSSVQFSEGQLPTNAGLILPKLRPFRTRNNAVETTKNVVTFTDYSVKFSPRDDTTNRERGRIYWYKIIPMFNDTPVSFIDNSDTVLDPNANDYDEFGHLVRVIVPPPNMAFIPRIIANRAMCAELGREGQIDTGPSGFYSCEYKGVGASMPPSDTLWSEGTGVYDIGRDILMDRFELGCNFTRGKLIQDGGATTSTYGGALSAFSPAVMGTFKGCTTGGDTDVGTSFLGKNLNPDDLPSNWLSAKFIGNTSDALTTADELVQGDCIGDGGRLDVYNTNPCPVGPGVSNNPRRYWAPGLTDIEDGNTIASCDDLYQVSNYPFHDSVAQSEYGAVFYRRSGGTLASDVRYPPNVVDATGATIGNPGGMNQCAINLPYINASARVVPRWIPFDDMVRNGINLSSGQKDILDMTMADIVNDTDLYNSTTVIAPASPWSDRLKAQKKLAHTMLSNASKLPPVTGMGRRYLYDVCQTWEVEVGMETGGSFYRVGESEKKRIMRRKEFIAASAWSATSFDDYIVGDVNGVKFENNNHDDDTNTANNECYQWNSAGGTWTLVDPQGASAGCGAAFNAHCNGGLPCSHAALGFKVTSTARRPAFGDTGNHFNNTIAFIERGDLNVSMGGVAVNGSCNSGRRRDSELGTLTSGDKLGAGYVSRDYEIFMTGTSRHDVSHTGHNARNENTEFCQSRYGVQDLIGNVGEQLSDEFFCDETLRELYIGDPGNVSASGLILDGNTPVAGTRSVVTGSSGAFGVLAWGLWVREKTGLGSCSPVEKFMDPSALDGDPAKDRSIAAVDGQYLSSIYDVNGTNGYNDDVIETQARKSFDQEAVLDLRTPDGYFFDFAENGYGPRISRADILQFKNCSTGNTDSRCTTPTVPTDTGARFFNPVLGVPVRCEGSPDPCDPDNGNGNNLDLLRYTINTISGFIDPAKDDWITEANFPTNNSNFYNAGYNVAQYEGSSQRLGYHANGNNDSTVRTIITDFNSGSVITTTGVGNDSGVWPDTTWYQTAAYSTGSSIVFNSAGGDYATVSAGRYYTDVAAQYSINSASNSTGRCTIGFPSAY